MRLVLVVGILLTGRAALAQSAATALIGTARTQIAAQDLDSAESSLAIALEQAAYLMDSVWVYIWYGVVQHLRGRDELARQSFRRALILHPNPGVDRLDTISPRLAELFDRESRARRVRWAYEVDQPARLRSIPVFVYPPELRVRRVSGPALIRAIVDTLGVVEQKSIEVHDTPDAAFVEPLKAMIRGATFHPARVRDRPVRSWASYQFTITPPRPGNPLHLIEAARSQLRQNNADSALQLIDQAVENNPEATPGIRVYGLLIQGMALHANSRDSHAAASLASALRQYRELKARGVDFAPFLERLADSLGRSQRLTPQRE